MSCPIFPRIWRIRGNILENALLIALCGAESGEVERRHFGFGAEILFSSGEGVESLSCKKQESLQTSRCPRPKRPQGTRPSGSDGGAVEGNLTPFKGRGRGARNDEGDSQSC